MHLFVLPFRVARAAENMAEDLLLLECAARPGALWYRHYGWSVPAFTFGVSQSFAAVRAEAGDGFETVRRATGGGVVNHADDWTYALVAPAGHDLAEMKAAESYRAVHAAVASALASQGAPATLVPCPRESCEAGSPRFISPCTQAAPSARAPGVCFTRPEIYDVVREDDGRKLAGAAQKRTRNGILFQGSVSRGACPEVADWRAFEEALLVRLALVTGSEILPADFPPVSADSRARALARFDSDEWNMRR